LSLFIALVPVHPGIFIQTKSCLYTFKIFGRCSDSFVDRVRDIIAAILGALPPDAVSVRESSHGRYLSVTVLVRVESRDQLERVYADLRADGEVLLYI
jgi:putative lipoic acid-binding regulatory protein